MSDSISPWIASYFIALAEQHGGNMSSIPRYTKKKKTQLIEFLTYDQDDVIWARISDKEHVCPIRLSRDAVQSYTSLTQHKTAIIIISHFKASFSRIPQGNRTMSKDSVLMIDCDSFTVLGSLGEAIYGNPQPIESNNDLLEWSRGLRQHGGAGNCLKDRKQEALKNNALNLPPPELLLPQIAINQARPQPVVPNPVSVTPKKDSHDSCAYQYQETWPITKNPLFRRPPHDVATLLASMKVDLDSSGDESISKSEPLGQVGPPCKRRRIDGSFSPAPQTSPSQPRFRSATPLIDEWPASEAHNPPTESPSSRSHSPVRVDPNITSSPAQRKKRLRPVPSSPPVPTEELQVVTAESFRFTPPPLFPSAPTRSPNASAALTDLKLSDSPPTHARRQVIRKVPRPPQPVQPLQSLPDPIVLVPNSDISTSYSLSQRDPQNQPSHSQPDLLSQQSDLVQSQEIDKVGPRPSSPVHVEETDRKSNSDVAVVGYQVPNEIRTHDKNKQASPLSPDHPTYESGFPETVTTDCEKLVDISSTSSLHGVQSSSKTDATISQSRQAETDFTNSDHESQDDECEDANEQQKLSQQTRKTSTNEQSADVGRANLQHKEDPTNPPAPEATIAHDPPESVSIEINKHLSAPGPDILEQATVTGTDARSEEDPGRTTKSDFTPVEVQHDAGAWASPSFLRHSSDNTKSKAGSDPSFVQLSKSKTVPLSRAVFPLVSHALQKSRLLNGQPDHKLPQPAKAQVDKTTSRFTQNLVAKKRALHHNNNQNTEPSRDSKSSQESRSDRDVVSDLAPENARPNKSKRKKQASDTATRETASKATSTDKKVPDGQGSQKQLKRLASLLPRFDIDNLILAEQPQPLVSWEMLKDILYLTEQDRKEESLKT